VERGEGRGEREGRGGGGEVTCELLRLLHAELPSAQLFCHHRLLVARSTGRLPLRLHLALFHPGEERERASVW
jgi:hypothetical protein